MVRGGVGEVVRGGGSVLRWEGVDEMVEDFGRCLICGGIWVQQGASSLDFSGFLCNGMYYYFLHDLLTYILRSASYDLIGPRCTV